MPPRAGRWVRSAAITSSTTMAGRQLLGAWKASTGLSWRRALMSDLLRQSPFDPVRERRLVIIADWLPPDFGAVGQYMQMRARSLAERGHDVTLVGLSSTASSVKHEAVSAGTLTELRLAAKPVPRNSLLARLLWTIRTDCRLVFAAFRSLRAADGIVFTGSPPFLVHVLTPLKPLWKGRLIYRITDFYPECL